MTLRGRAHAHKERGAEGAIPPRKLSGLPTAQKRWTLESRRSDASPTVQAANFAVKLSGPMTEGEAHSAAWHCPRSTLRSLLLPLDNTAFDKACGEFTLPPSRPPLRHVALVIDWNN